MKIDGIKINNKPSEGTKYLSRGKTRAAISQKYITMDQEKIVNLIIIPFLLENEATVANRKTAIYNSCPLNSKPS